MLAPSLVDRAMPRVAPGEAGLLGNSFDAGAVIAATNRVMSVAVRRLEQPSERECDDCRCECVDTIGPPVRLRAATTAPDPAGTCGLGEREFGCDGDAGDDGAVNGGQRERSDTVGLEDRGARRVGDRRPHAVGAL